MWITAMIVFTWRVTVPDILDHFRAESAVYLALVLAFIPMVSVVGWFGAKLTFPMEKH